MAGIQSRLWGWRGTGSAQQLVLQLQGTGSCLGLHHDSTKWCSAASPASPLLIAGCTLERDHRGADAIRAPRIPVINSSCGWEIWHNTQTHQAQDNISFFFTLSNESWTCVLIFQFLKLNLYRMVQVVNCNMWKIWRGKNICHLIHLKNVTGKQCTEHRTQ